MCVCVCVCASVSLAYLASRIVLLVPPTWNGQGRGHQRASTRAAYLLEQFDRKQNTLRVRDARRVRRDRRVLRLAHLRQRLKLLSPAFNPGQQPGHGPAVEALPSPHRVALAPLAPRPNGGSDGIEGVEGVEEVECAGCDEYSGGSVGSEFDESSG